MGHFARLYLIGRVTYYLGWLALLCGGLAHLNVARSVFTALTLSQRNLFEVSVVSFLICIASELRLLAPAEGEAQGGVRRQAAA